MGGSEINAGDNPPSLLLFPGVVQFGLTSNLLDLGQRSARSWWASIGLGFSGGLLHCINVIWRGW